MQADQSTNTTQFERTCVSDTVELVPYLTASPKKWILEVDSLLSLLLLSSEALVDILNIRKTNERLAIKAQLVIDTFYDSSTHFMTKTHFMT